MLKFIEEVKGGGATRIREEEAAFKYHSGHETLIQAEGGGFIAAFYQDIVNFSENEVSVDFSVDCI